MIVQICIVNEILVYQNYFTEVDIEGVEELQCTTGVSILYLVLLPRVLAHASIPNVQYYLFFFLIQCLFTGQLLVN
jgi:hypothetical protein